MQGGEVGEADDKLWVPTPPAVASRPDRPSAGCRTRRERRRSQPPRDRTRRPRSREPARRRIRPGSSAVAAVRAHGAATLTLQTPPFEHCQLRPRAGPRGRRRPWPRSRPGLRPAAGAGGAVRCQELGGRGRWLCGDATRSRPSGVRRRGPTPASHLRRRVRRGAQPVRRSGRARIRAAARRALRRTRGAPRARRR